MDVQPSLLRVLETGEVTPVGSDETRAVRVRVVSATNRTLGDEVRAGRFREDLFYRLAVVTLAVPPLRERPEDIGPLAERFAAMVGVSLAPGVVEELRRGQWPGNVRELRNVVQHYAALGTLRVVACALFRNSSPRMQCAHSIQSDFFISPPPMQKCPACLLP